MRCRTPRVERLDGAGGGAGRNESGAVAVLAAAVLMCTAGVAHAAPGPCFQLREGRGPAVATSSRRVTLATQIGTRDGCEYALDANGPWKRLPAGDAERRDFASLLIELGGDGQESLPRAVYARGAASDALRRTAMKRGDSASTLTAAATEGDVQSVFLAGCTEYLLSSGRGFELRVPVDVQRPEVHRVEAPDDCGAALLALRFVALPNDGADATVRATRHGPWGATLKLGQTSLALEPGRWGVYATRGEADAGVLVGRIASRSSLTPLRVALRDVRAGNATAPWLRASWDGGGDGGADGGGLRFEPASAAFAAGDAWAELRAAAATGSLWLAGTRVGEVGGQGGGAPGAADSLLGSLAVGPGGTAITLPVGPLDAHMAARYGRAGPAMVPSFTDWNGAYDGLSLCLAGRYAPPGVFAASADGEDTPPAPPPEQPVLVPTGALCAPFSKLVAPLSDRAGRALPAGQVCLRRTNRVLTSSGVREGPERGESCSELPSGPGDGRPPEILLATAGDAITFAGVGANSLFVCLDNECQPMPEPGAWQPLLRGGLVEVRYAADVGQAQARFGLTLVRIGVIDPATDWHPVGLYDFDGPPPRDRWTTLAHDEDEVFTYVRQHQSLRFRLSTSPTLAAAWNARATRATRITADLPLLTRGKGDLDAPPGAALVILPTRDAACPNEPASVVRASVLEPEGLIADERFHVHLAHYRGENRPFDCLATAGLRVTDALSWRASPTIRFGVLGDVQAMMFITHPGAVGLAAPLAYGRWRWGLGLGLDLSASLTSAVTLRHAELTRTGLGVAAMVYWGPEQTAPRLLSLGLMLHAATGTDPAAEPDATLAAGLNLSTLLDMAGGR